MWVSYDYIENTDEGIVKLVTSKGKREYVGKHFNTIYACCENCGYGIWEMMTKLNNLGQPAADELITKANKTTEGLRQFIYFINNELVLKQGQLWADKHGGTYELVGVTSYKPLKRKNFIGNLNKNWTLYSTVTGKLKLYYKDKYSIKLPYVIYKDKEELKAVEFEDFVEQYTLVKK